MKPTSAGTRTSRNHESAPKQKSAACAGSTKSNSIAADDRRKGDRESVSQERGRRRSMQRVLGARNSNPIAADDGRGEQKNTDRKDLKDKEKQPGMRPEGP